MHWSLFHKTTGEASIQMWGVMRAYSAVVVFICLVLQITQILVQDFLTD